MTGFGTIKVNNGYLEYLVLTAYSIEVTFKTTTLIEETNDNEIISLKTSSIDNPIIKLDCTLHNLNYGDIRSDFIIKSILKISPHRYKLYTNIPNKTRHFLLPILRYTKKEWLHECLINAYISKDNNYLLLHYRFSTAPVYLNFETELKKRKGYNFKKDINKDSVIYVFTIPLEFKNDIEIFKKGKYSHFSEVLKSQILSFHNYNFDSLTSKILRKDEDYKRQLELDFGVPISSSLDLYDIPVYEEEFKNIEDIC